MSLTYKINDNFLNNPHFSYESKAKQGSSPTNYHKKKTTVHEFVSNNCNSLPKFNKANLFYNRNKSLTKNPSHIKALTQTNTTNFFQRKNPLNLSQSKISENLQKNPKNSVDLKFSKRNSEEKPQCHTCEDSPFKIKEIPLKKIIEENIITEMLPTEYSDVVIQELPCTRLFNTKFLKKMSTDSNENSTRTSSGYFGGKFYQNSEFQYEKSVTKGVNKPLLITNKDTGEKQDINKVNQEITRQKYLEKMNEIKDVWQVWWQEKKENSLQLFTSVKTNNTKTLMKMMEITGDLKPDVNAKDEKDWSPLHYASLIGNDQMTALLINYGADVGLLNNLKQTSLIIASQKGFENLVYLLLDRGCDVNAQDISNNTALHYACIYGYLQIIKTLLSTKNINIFLKNIENKTALQATHFNLEIYRLFDDFIKIKKKEIGDTNPINETACEKKSNNLEHITKENQKEIIGPQSFNVISLLGKGSFAEVYLVEKKNEKKLYAMKVLHKNKIIRNCMKKYVLGERNILSAITHPFIVKLNYAFQTNDEMFLVLDFCSGGDLGKYLLKEKKFSEEKAKFYICEVLLALEYLHQNDTIYRDLKPDNVVIDSEGHALLTDFGLSKQGVFDGASTNSFCGSIAYLAPEILKKNGHGKSVDWYLLGVFLFEMLVGVTPYYSMKKEEIFSKIESSEEVKIPNFLSFEARDLLKKLLEKNPKKRLGCINGAEEIKNHEFFKKINWDHVLEKKLIPPYPYLNTKKNFKPFFIDFEDKNLFQTNNLSGWSFLKDNQE